MPSLILDTGGLIALERRDRRVGALLAAAAHEGVEAATSAGCVAQVWRDPARQALLTRALRGIREHPLDPAAARKIGALLAGAGTDDIVDAAVIELAADGDVVITSDPDDMRRVAAAAGLRMGVVAV